MLASHLLLSPLETLHRYYEAFSTLDLQAIAEYFSEPCMSIGPAGVFSAGTHADFIKAIAPFIEQLRAKDYDHSEFVDPKITELTSTAVLIRGTAVRYVAGPSELERVEITYLLHSDGTQWRIAVMVLPH